MSTVIIFCTQNIVIGLNRINKLSVRWWVGMGLACLGVILLSEDKNKNSNDSSGNQINENENIKENNESNHLTQ